jgi:hypothetical protein
MTTLLTRDEFRQQVMEREGCKCVYCGEPAVDAHHIMERRLWPDGGYYIDNGVAVCARHHMACERTLISPKDVREAAGIVAILLPPQLYDDEEYDKWGNIVLPNGNRLKGELFFDLSVQKVLSEGGVLPLFSHLIKYPRTFHLPWSPGMHDDDRMMTDLSHLESCPEVIIHNKFDGENTSCYHCSFNPSIHARSIHGYESHPSRDWMRAFHARFCNDVPFGWRISIENMYATHSIHYKNLDTYAYGFAVWNEKNEVLSWDESLEWFDLLGVTPMPLLYRGPWNEEFLKKLWTPEIDGNPCEGYVVRDSGLIPYREFRLRVGKFVRKGHVQTTKHWMRGQLVIANELKEGLTGFEKVDSRY